MTSAMTIENEKIWTVSGLYRDGVKRLRAAGVDTAEQVVGWLLSGIAGESHLAVSGSQRHLSPEQVQQWEAALARAVRHEPVQYITGHTGFRDLTIACDARALIPRPETERLVDFVLSEKRLHDTDRPVIVDVGTGTGCIALSLAWECPLALVYALDLSDAALSLARENARLNKLDHRVRFLRSNLLAGWVGDPVDVVVANLPYIAREDCLSLPANVRYEPISALDGGEDGLAFIRTLIKEAPSVFQPGGVLYLEIGMDQGAAVEQLLCGAGFLDVEIRQDWSGRDRYARGVHPC